MDMKQEIAPSALDFKTIEQLAKLLRLIFISDNPGEVANAVAAVRRMLVSANADGHWLASRLFAPNQKEPSDKPRSERVTIQWCLDRSVLLSPQDREFLRGVTKQLKPLSVKQQKWLSDIVARLENRRAA
jgi:hypothetical protein